MKKNTLLLLLLLITPFPLHAADGFQLNFEFTYSDGRIERGKFYTTNKQHSWQKGLEQSYLKLTCRTHSDGRIERLYSTIDYFSGLRMIHKIVGDEIEISLLHQTVQSRLTEIRELPKKKCRELLPIVNTKSEIYRLKAVDGGEDTRAFGDKMSLRVTIQKIHGK